MVRPAPSQLIVWGPCPGYHDLSPTLLQCLGIATRGHFPVPRHAPMVDRKRGSAKCLCAAKLLGIDDIVYEQDGNRQKTSVYKTWCCPPQSSNIIHHSNTFNLPDSLSSSLLISPLIPSHLSNYYLRRTPALFILNNLEKKTPFTLQSQYL
jgi:hypothetical protein